MKNKETKETKEFCSKCGEVIFERFWCEAAEVNDGKSGWIHHLVIHPDNCGKKKKGINKTKT